MLGRLTGDNPMVNAPRRPKSTPGLVPGTAGRPAAPPHRPGQARSGSRPSHPTPTQGAGPGASGVAPLQEGELQKLDELLGHVPAPLQPLDLTALDGFLVGVLLQPQRIPPSRWLPFATDDEGRGLPAAWPARARLQALIQQRHAELDALIEGRQWFDPWITDVDDDTLPTEAVQPWVLGFATACGEFPALTEGPGSDEPELIEALAQLYQHLDPADLEDADALLAEIDTLEPPASMEEAIESLVRGCLLLADVSRPVRQQGSSTTRPPAPKRAVAGAGARKAGPRRR